MKTSDVIIGAAAIAVVVVVVRATTRPAPASPTSSVGTAAGGLVDWLSGNTTANRVGTSILTKLGFY